MVKDYYKELINEYTQICRKNDLQNEALYDEYDVKKGLRNKKGMGVVAGLTNISRIEAFKEENGERIPSDGKLYYRGYDIDDLVKGFLKEERFGFEETAYLLIFGQLPNSQELENFANMLRNFQKLPKNFTKDVIMKAASADVMNSLTKSVLTLASYDEKISDFSLENIVRQCIQLIAEFPMLSIYGYHSYNYYERDDSLYIHRPDRKLSMAENILRMLRPDMKYTQLEATVLDIALVLHMEHGGGNNSTFTTRVVTSSGSDTYSVMAAALSSLKGPKHGGANLKVVNMMKELQSEIKDYNDEDEIKAYLLKIFNKEAFDKKGLIYGMGHAVYSKSDPREKIFRKFVESLSYEKGRHEEFNLYSAVERLAPEIISQKAKIYKGVSPNVDFYSGFVYSMLGIPNELYTPLFAMARIVGWSAHRIEELINVDKIIRPAYKSIVEKKQYIPVDERNV